MKKFYITMIMLAFASFTFAQTKTGSLLDAKTTNHNIKMQVSEQKALGDTLMHFDGSSFFVNPTDDPTFGFLNEDIDNSSAAGTNGFTGAFLGFYSTTAADFLHDDVDTALFLGATSWFDTPGQADNWFSWGPITVPASGASLTWAIKCNPGYRDGYEVLTSGAGMNNYTDFTDAAIYTRTDEYPSTTEATDTIWQYVTVNIPNTFNGLPVYVGFHHNATDMDVIWLDEISVIEANTIGVIENSNYQFAVSQNQPNPANTSTVIKYEIPETANVTVDIYDITGRIVFSANEGLQSAGKHLIAVNTNNFTNGNYFYTLTAGNNKMTKRMSVVK